MLDKQQLITRREEIKASLQELEQTRLKLQGELDTIEAELSGSDIVVEKTQAVMHDILENDHILHEITETIKNHGTWAVDCDDAPREKILKIGTRKPIPGRWHFPGLNFVELQPLAKNRLNDEHLFFMRSIWNQSLRYTDEQSRIVMRKRKDHKISLVLNIPSNFARDSHGRGTAFAFEICFPDSVYASILKQLQVNPRFIGQLMANLSPEVYDYTQDFLYTDDMKKTSSRIINFPDTIGVFGWQNTDGSRGYRLAPLKGGPVKLIL